MFTTGNFMYYCIFITSKYLILMSFERSYPNNLISNIVGAYTHYWNKNYFNDDPSDAYLSQT